MTTTLDCSTCEYWKQATPTTGTCHKGPPDVVINPRLVISDPTTYTLSIYPTTVLPNFCDGWKNKAGFSEGDH